MTRRTDLAALTLAAVVRVLPRHRKEWGRAMRAELAALPERAERRRFAGGCARAVLLAEPAVRAAAGYAAVLAFAVLVIRGAAGLPSPGVRVEATVLVAAIAALAWCARRRTVLGPVDAGRVPRLLRLAGYGTVMATVAVWLSVGTNDPSGWWLAAAAIAVYLTGFLRATTESATAALSLPMVAVLTLAGLALWWIPMLLLSAVRASPALTFLAAFALVPVGSALGARTGSRTRGVLSGLAAATATLLLMFLAAVLTYRLAPGLVPDVSPGGLTPEARAENNRIEAVDPYVADFLLGAVLSGILTVLSALPARARPRLVPTT